MKAKVAKEIFSSTYQSSEPSPPESQYLHDGSSKKMYFGLEYDSVNSVVTVIFIVVKND